MNNIKIIQYEIKKEVDIFNSIITLPKFMYIWFALTPFKITYLINLKNV
jgi:hypothetical protein